MSLLNDLHPAPPNLTTKLRRMLAYWAATAALYLLCAGIALREAAQGLIPQHRVTALLVLASGASLVFYLLIRLSSRLRIPNWKLARAQALFAVLFDLALYCVLARAHTAMLIGLPVIIVFCAFALRPQQTVLLAAFALAGLALTQVLLLAYRPAGLSVEGEAINFLLTAVGVISVAVITSDLARLRQRVGLQKRGLELALERIKHVAATDELTSLPNRRRMNELLQQTQAQRARTHEQLCIALLDVDFFKKINDRFGHAAGDDALARVAAAIRGELRAGDTVARWGGEEFLLLMPNTAIADAHLVLDRMQLRCNRITVGDNGESLTISFSAGIAECGQHESLDACIRRADIAMFQGKNDGRGKVVRSTPDACRERPAQNPDAGAAR